MADAEAPLLGKLGAAAFPLPPPPAKRNKYPFFCAVLASMTSVLMGYNRGAVGRHQHLLRRRRAASRLDLRPPRPPPHHRASQRLLPRRPARHGARRRVHHPHGRPLHRRSRQRVRARHRPRLRRRDCSGVLPRPPHLSPRGIYQQWSDAKLRVKLGLLGPARAPVVAGDVRGGGSADGVPGRRRAHHARVAAVARNEGRAASPRPRPCSTRPRTRPSRPSNVCSRSRTSSRPAAPGGAWTEVATKAGVRRVLAIVLTLQFFQQSSGIDSVVLHGPRILAMAGVTSNTFLLSLNVLFSVAKAGSILIAMSLADRAVRRPLLLASTGGMAASLLVLGTLFAAFAGARDNAAVAAASFAAVVAFSVGLGPLAWVYSSEILPLRLRGQGAGLGTAMNRIMSGVVTMTFISLYQGITMAGAFYLYAAIAWPRSFLYTCACRRPGDGASRTWRNSSTPSDFVWSDQTISWMRFSGIANLALLELS
ncbi:unnamed protein product [Urochloa humidicola]